MGKTRLGIDKVTDDLNPLEAVYVALGLYSRALTLMKQANGREREMLRKIADLLDRCTDDLAALIFMDYADIGDLYHDDKEGASDT